MIRTLDQLWSFTHNGLRSVAANSASLDALKTVQSKSPNIVKLKSMYEYLDAQSNIADCGTTLIGDVLDLYDSCYTASPTATWTGGQEQVEFWNTWLKDDTLISNGDVLAYINGYPITMVKYRAPGADNLLFWSLQDYDKHPLCGGVWNVNAIHGSHQATPLSGYLIPGSNEEISLAAILVDLSKKLNTSSALLDVLSTTLNTGNVSVTKIEKALEKYAPTDTLILLQEKIANVSSDSYINAFELIGSVLSSGVPQYTEGEDKFAPLDTPEYCDDVFGACVAVFVAVAAVILSIVFNVVASIVSAALAILSAVFSVISKALPSTQAQSSMVPHLCPTYNYPVHLSTQGDGAGILGASVAEAFNEIKPLFGTGALVVEDYCISPTDTTAWRYSNATGLPAIGWIVPAALSNTDSAFVQWFLTASQVETTAIPSFQAGEITQDTYNAISYSGSLDTEYNSDSTTVMAARDDDRRLWLTRAIVNMVMMEAMAIVESAGGVLIQSGIPRLNATPNSNPLDEVTRHARVYDAQADGTTENWEGLLVACAVALSTSYYNPGAWKASTWDELTGFLSFHFTQKLFERYATRLLRLLNHRGAVVIAPGASLQHPMVTWPEVSINSVITAVLLTAVASIAIASVAYVGARKIRTKATSRLALRETEFEKAKKQYLENPSKDNAKSLDKANRKLSRAWKMAGATGCSMYNGFQTEASASTDGYPDSDSNGSVMGALMTMVDSTDAVKTLIAG